MKVYLAGRIKSDPDYRDKFAKAANKLRSWGLIVYNPAAANVEVFPLSRIMAIVLPQLCECDAIAILPGTVWRLFGVPVWWRSSGARIEWLLAKYLKKKVIRL